MELQTVLGYKIEVNENTNYLQRIAVTFLIFNRIIFHLVDGFRFQPHHPPFIPTIHTVLFINCNLSTLWVKFHHDHSFSIPRLRVFKFWIYLSYYTLLSGTFHLLSKPAFSLWNNYFLCNIFLIIEII